MEIFWTHTTDTTSANINQHPASKLCKESNLVNIVFTCTVFMYTDLPSEQSNWEVKSTLPYTVSDHPKCQAYVVP